MPILTQAQFNAATVISGGVGDTVLTLAGGTASGFDFAGKTFVDIDSIVVGPPASGTVVALFVDDITDLPLISSTDGPTNTILTLTGNAFLNPETNNALILDLFGAGIDTINAVRNGVQDVTIESTGPDSYMLTSVDRPGSPSLPWVERVQTYEAGVLRERVTEQDNGLVTTETFDVNGIRTRSVVDDSGANRQIWDTVTTDFAPDGSITLRTVVFDTSQSRALEVQTFTNGIISGSTTTFDSGDTLVWQFDANGRQTVSTLTYALTGTTKIVGRDDAATIDQVLNATSAVDTMIGNSGNDIFRFALGNAPDDRIVDFTDGTDQLDLTAYGIDEVADLLNIRQLGSNTAIKVADGEQILLIDFNAANLTDDDFVV